MRSLSKEAEIMNAATYIIKTLKNKFSKVELQKEKEIEKLRRDKAVLEVQRKEINK